MQQNFILFLCVCVCVCVCVCMRVCVDVLAPLYRVYQWVCFFLQNEALYIALTSLLEKMETADSDAASRYEFLWVPNILNGPFILAFGQMCISFWTRWSDSTKGHDPEIIFSIFLFSYFCLSFLPSNRFLSLLSFFFPIHFICLLLSVSSYYSSSLCSPFHPRSFPPSLLLVYFIFLSISSSSSSSCSGRIRFDSCSLCPQNEIGPSISSSVVLCAFFLLIYIVVLV